MKVFFLTAVVIAFISGAKCKDLREINVELQDKMDNVTKIVGGKVIDISVVPYQVVLQKHGFFICGGSIITRDYILTAAHCKLNVCL